MKSNCRGIALVELMIIVIIISTVATAYWNFYISRDYPPIRERVYSPIDSIADDILDEIALNLRMARPDPMLSRDAVIIHPNNNFDRIDVLAKDVKFVYFVDQSNRLIKESSLQRGALIDDVISFKATPMGTQTLVITMQLGPKANVLDSTEINPRTYSRVVSVNSRLWGMQ